MELYVTPNSPFARVARVVVLEKGLADRVVIVVAQTRTPDSPYYAINPSGRVPYLVTDDGLGLEDSVLVATYLDHLDGAPRLRPSSDPTWAYARLEASARSMADGVAVWGREMKRPSHERSGTVLAHEVARAHRMADWFAAQVDHPFMTPPLNLAQLMLATCLDYAEVAGLGRLTDGRPGLAAWHERLRALPSMVATRPR
jgi:glutathione S-transferase